MITKIFKSIKSNKMLTIIETMLAFLLGMLWSHGDRFLSHEKKSEISTLLLAQLGISALLLIIALLLALIYLLVRKEKISEFDDYKFNPRAGAWIHKESAGKRLCASCKADGIVSPLYVSNDDGYFHCPKCGNKSINYPTVIFVNLPGQSN